MKLVDILARELKVWPEGNYFAWQDFDREIRFSHTTRHDFHASILADDHVRSRNGDYPVYGVTHAEWQAAVDALNAPKVVEWDGDRLPPTGTVCEHFGTADHTNWIEVQVIGHGHVRFHDVAFFEYMSVTSGYTVSYSTANNFRPIRTAEQIAAEEREKGIQAIQDAYTYKVESCTHKILHSQAARLYDAGCRLQVAK